MSANKPQMRTRSEVKGNTAQSSCTKSSAVSKKFKDIKTYGNKLTMKKEDSFRLIFENVNGLPPDMGYCSSSWKYKRLQHMIARFQIDAISLVETQINPALLPHTFSIRKKLFNDKESATILSHNRQEHIGMRQQGGVFTGVIGQATSCAISTGSDAEGLGRWNWIELKGQKSSTYIITAYQCVRSKQTVNTVFLQRERHLKRCNKHGCPRQHFIADLIKFIAGLMEGDNKIILAADVNEHAKEGVLAKELAKIGLTNTYTKMFNQAGPASHITGSDPIDGIWTSSNLSTSAVSILPQKFGAGDHRVILADFDLDQILERNVRICRPKIRRLICENKKSVANYNAIAWKHLQFHNIPKRLKDLEDSFEHVDRDRWNIRLNMIDEQITETLLHAEKLCRKLRMGEVDYSPEMSKASEVWYTWRLALKVAEGEKHRKKELSQLVKKWRIEIDDMRNKWSIKMNIERSRKEYLDIKDQQALLRKRYLEDTGRTAQWKKEKQKRQFKRCNSTFGKQKMKSINKVEHVEEGNLVQVVTKEEVENAIMKENSSRFRLAYSSPLLNDELSEELGLSGEGSLSKDILGSQSQLQRHPEVQEVFELFQGSQHQRITTQIMTEQWIDHWEGAKERTSSSYSGLHFGHYKAHTEKYEIAEIKCKLVNLAIKSGQPLTRWINGVSVMLEKIAGNINVQKLRAILLLEADFNALHKIIFNNRLMPKLEESGTIPVEIIGGRRSQAATHLALNKKLISDIANVRKLPMITICADATNCYDRVAHPFASLCAQYFGLEVSYLAVLFRAIQSMKMFLRTSYGISQTAYSGEEGRPFQGLVQGSGAAPALWMIISIFLVRYLYSKNVTTQLSTPISGIILPLVALMFVDDADLYVFNSGTDTTRDLVLKAQRLLDAWHNILTITGGSLKLSKCYWTLQDYQWQQGKCKMIYSTSHKLHIDLENQRKELVHLRADQMRTLVGVPMQLNHQNEQIVQAILSKTTAYQNKLASCKLNSSDIMFGYQHYWWPSIKYPAPVLSLDHDSNVLADLHAAMLPKLRVMRTFPTVMRSVPSFLGGLNLKRLEVETIAQSLHHLITLYSSDTSTQLLLKILIEYHQLELGSDKQIFSLNVDDYWELTTPTWITTLWKNISRFKLSLQLPPLNMGITMQEGDRFISDIAVQQKLPVDQRKAINRVRIKLQLLLLSDLLVYDGNVIKHPLRQGIEDESYISTLCWPRSETSRKDIGIWKMFMSSISRSDGSIYANLRWTKPNQRHRRSMAFVSRDKKLIQVIIKGEHKMFKQSRLSNKYVLTDTVTHGCFQDRVEVELQKNRCKVFSSISTYQTDLPRQNQSMTNPLGLTTWIGHHSQICQILLSGKCLAVVDGSFFPEHQEYISAHWMFVYKKKVIGQGGFVAKVEQHLQSAYSSEVCGGLGILSSIKEIMTGQTEERINFTIGSDCQSAIHMFKTRQKVISFNSKLSEIVREILHIRNKFVKNLVTEKIAAHQDEVKPRHKWSLMEYVNVLCDAEAKKLIREQVATSGSPTLPFTLNSPMLVNGKKRQLTSTNMITDEIYKQIAAPYIEKKLHGIGMDDIDWEFRKLITQNLSTSQQIWLAKSYTNFSGTAHQLHRQKILSSDVCRVCNEEEERDVLHVLKCKHRMFSQFRNGKVTTLQLQLIKILDEDILPLCLLEWMLDPEYEAIEGIPEKAMSSLQQVGKRNVWFGMLPTMFLKWVCWKYESAKWLVRYMSLSVEMLHELWVERCNVVNECLLSKVKVEDHDNLLVQVKELYNSADIEPASVLHQYKNRLNKVSTGTLRGIVYELLATVGIETRNSSFHNDLLKHPRSKRCDLTPTVMSMRDRATVRRHDQTKRSKRKREDYEDMIEVETSQQRRRRR